MSYVIPSRSQPFPLDTYLSRDMWPTAVDLLLRVRPKIADQQEQYICIGLFSVAVGPEERNVARLLGELIGERLLPFITYGSWLRSKEIPWHEEADGIITLGRLAWIDDLIEEFGNE